MKENSIDIIALKKLQNLVATSPDATAFEKLYLLLYKDLHQFAYRIIKSNHIAEEIVSDVFVQLWKKKSEIASINNLRVFLYVAVKNQSLTYLYKAHKQRVSWIEKYADEPEMQAKQFNSEEILTEKELQKNLTEAIKILPIKCKIVFKLIKEDGLKYAEAARILNISIKTIENQMAIALKKISISLHIYYQGKNRKINN